MNELFVNVKVDREERPDVDAVYMDAVQAHDRPRRLADDRVHDARRPTVLRRHLLPQAAVPGAADRRSTTCAGTSPTTCARTSAPSARRSTRPRRSSPPTSCPDVDPPRTSAVQGLGTRLRPRVGRVRPGAEVPLDVQPRADAAGLHDHRRRRPAGRSWRPRSTPWPRAGCTTTSAAASPATRSIASGSCRTSRRCCTTRRCSCGRTCTACIVIGRTPWRQVVGETIDLRARASCATPTAASTRPRMPTHPMPTGTAPRGCSTRGRPTRCARRWLGIPDDVQSAALDWFGITADGNFEGRSIPNRLARPRELERPPDIEAARRRAVRRSRTSPAARARRQGAHRVERVVPVGPGRGGGRVRPAANGSTRRSPTASSCCANCAGRTGVGGASWQADGDPPARHDALGRRPRRPRRRVHATRRRPPGRPVGSTRRWRWPTRCSSGSGIR